MKLQSLVNEPTRKKVVYAALPELSSPPVISAVTLVGSSAEDATSDPFKSHRYVNPSNVDNRVADGLHQEKKNERTPFSSPEICAVVPYRRATQRVRKISGAGHNPQYTIYSLPNLADLLKQLLAPIMGAARKKLRYLVTTDHQLYFALEGEPNEFIPTHDRMAGKEKYAAQCLAAGNIFLVKTNDKFYLKGINHESGDFIPDFDSIKWVLALLFAHQALLPAGFIGSTIQIIELGQSPGNFQSWSIPTTVLFNELRQHVDIMLTKTPSNKNITPDEIGYKTSEAKLTVDPSPGLQTRRLHRFFEDSSASTPPRMASTSPIKPSGPKKHATKRTKIENNNGQNFYSQSSLRALEAFWDGAVETEAATDLPKNDTLLNFSSSSNS